MGAATSDRRDGARDDAATVMDRAQGGARRAAAPHAWRDRLPDGVPRRRPRHERGRLEPAHSHLALTRGRRVQQALATPLAGRATLTKGGSTAETVIPQTRLTRRCAAETCLWLRCRQ